MRCPRCHSEESRNTKFCGNCGAPLAQSGEPEQTSTQVLAAPPLRQLEPGETFAGRYQVIGKAISIGRPRNTASS